MSRLSDRLNPPDRLLVPQRRGGQIADETRMFPRFETPLRLLPFPSLGQTTEGRPLRQNTFGGLSSEFTITVTDERLNQGKPTVIPSIFDGELVDFREAIDRVVAAGGKDPETGRVLQGFDTIEEAEDPSRARSGNIRGTLNARGKRLFPSFFNE